MQSMDAGKNITQDTIKIFKNQNIERTPKFSLNVTCYWTTSNILINGPYTDSFLSHEVEAVTGLLEKNNKQSPQKDSFHCNYK